MVLIELSTFFCWVTWRVILLLVPSVDVDPSVMLVFVSRVFLYTVAMLLLVVSVGVVFSVMLVFMCGLVVP